jgi:hypothetical protein
MVLGQRRRGNASTARSFSKGCALCCCSAYCLNMLRPLGEGGQQQYTNPYGRVRTGAFAAHQPGTHAHAGARWQGKYSANEKLKEATKHFEGKIHGSGEHLWDWSRAVARWVLHPSATAFVLAVFSKHGSLASLLW